MLVVGADELLPENPLNVQASNVQDAFRIEAEKWFLHRFGIDFTHISSVENGAKNNEFAKLFPITLEGSNRVLLSSDPSIPVGSKVNLVSYVVTFQKAFTYTGTYNQGVGNVTDSLSFGKYSIQTKDTVLNFYTRSWHPNRTTFSPGNIQVRENNLFQLSSPIFGPGFGMLNLGIGFANPYPTLVRAVWTFPGSFVDPEYNEWTNCPNSY